MKSPCTTCTERHLGCHSKCEHYQEFNEHNKKRLKTIQKNKYEFYNYFSYINYKKRNIKSKEC